MDAMGINSGFLFLQCVLPLLWLVFTVAALVSLRQANLTGTTLALWVLIICAIPILGALAYGIIKPTAERQG